MGELKNAKNDDEAAEIVSKLFDIMDKCTHIRPVGMKITEEEANKFYTEKNRWDTLRGDTSALTKAATMKCAMTLVGMSSNFLKDSKLGKPDIESVLKETTTSPKKVSGNDKKKSECFLVGIYKYVCAAINCCPRTCEPKEKVQIVPKDRTYKAPEESISETGKPASTAVKSSRSTVDTKKRRLAENPLVERLLREERCAAARGLEA